MRILVLLSALLILTSCSVRAHLTLDSPSAAKIETDVRIAPEGTAAWAALRSLDNTLPEQPFEAKSLALAMGPRAHIETEPGHVHILAPVGSHGLTLSGLKITSSSWDVTVDRAFLRTLAARTVWGQSPALDTLLPNPDVKVSEQDDTDLLVYLLGSKVDEARARTLVAQSSVELTITVPRPVLEAPGAETIKGNSATYRWPLVRLLSLSPPLVLHGTF